MPMLTPCLEEIEGADGRVRPCGVLSSGSRCATHQTEHERTRIKSEPWRRLYSHPAWFNVRPKIWRRDNARCTFEISGRRCNTEALLEVHHEIKVRDLWKRYEGNWPRFLKAATDERILRLLCPEHHKIVDNLLDERGRFKPAVLKPPPRPPKPRRKRRERRRHEIPPPIDSVEMIA